MYALKRKWKFDIGAKDISWSEDLGVIDYNIRYFYQYSNVLSVINEIYIRLIRKGINNELLDAISNIVEKLNNLVHFQYGGDCKDEDTLVNEYLKLFDTFKYQKLSEFSKETNIKVHKVQYISNDIINQLNDNYKASFNKEYEDIRDNYKGFYIGSLSEDGESYPLISCHNDMKVISILSNTDNDTVLKGLLEVFRAIYSIDKEDLFLEKYYRFHMTRGRIHKEIVCLINNLLKALNYLFNSTSFRENEYYLFDRYELERRVDIDIEAWLSHTKALILTEIDYAIEER